MQKNLSKKTIAGFDCFVVEGDPQAPYILLMHGYGANHQDLLPLSAEVNLPFSPNWIFPNAPLIAFPDMNMCRTWLPWDQQMVEKLLHPELVKECTKMCTEQLLEIEQSLLVFLKELNVPLSQIFLGGFSQGAVLAAFLTLRLPTSIKGLLVLSGGLFIDQHVLDCLSGTKKELPFFQSHGQQDPILSFCHAQALEKTLLEQGLLGKLLPFQGGHEIPPSIIKSLENFLVLCLP